MKAIRINVNIGMKKLYFLILCFSHNCISSSLEYISGLVPAFCLQEIAISSKFFSVVALLATKGLCVCVCVFTDHFSNLALDSHYSCNYVGGLEGENLCLFLFHCLVKSLSAALADP